MEAAKNKRKQSKSRFTRNLNTLNALLSSEGNVPRSIVEPQFETMKKCWQELEDSQDAYLEFLDDVEEEGGLDYLNDPGEKHTTALVKYSEYLNNQVLKDRVSEDKRADEQRLFEDVKRKKRAMER